jgi:hypothetical protein
VGEVVNARVDVDYTEQPHEFRDVPLPAGAVLAVESLANSNDLIPEGNGFAFARGRWRRLSLESAGEAVEPTIDLSVSLAFDSSTFNQDKNIQITAMVQNLSLETVATSPQLVIALPEHMSFIESTICTADQQRVSCALSELAPSAVLEVALIAHLNEQKEAVVEAVVSADQNDANLADNTVQEVFSVPTQSEPATTVPTDAPTTEPVDEVPAANGDTTVSGDTDGDSSSGGSGAFAPVFWLPVLMLLRLRRKPLNSCESFPCAYRRPVVVRGSRSTIQHCRH